MTDNQAVGTLSVKHQLGLLLKAVLAVGAVALLVLAYRHFTYKEPVAPAPLPEGIVEMSPSQMATLKVEAVGGGDGWLQTAATGMIAVDETRATPIFLPYSGQVTQVMVQQGATVVQGQPLLTLRTSDVVDARNALFGAAAARSSAFAAAKLAEDNLKRQEQIYRTAGGALRDYEQARNDAVAAQAALRSAEATLGAARDKLEIYGKSQGEIARLEGARDVNGYHPETTFRAPIGGVIASRAVSPGQFVQVGGTTPVLTIANPGRVWLVAQLAESDAPHVHLGDRVDVTVSAFPGRVFQAVVDNIASALDPQSHRLPVRATIANPDGALKPQMFANFTIRHQDSAPVNGRPVMSVPAQAVIRESDNARVWIQISANRFRCVDVTLGESHNGRVDVTSGLKGGEKVVTTGAIFVNEAGFGA